MKATPKSRDRKQLVWPAAGMVLGLLVAMLPLRTSITLNAGITAGCADLLLVLILSAHPIGARVAVLVAGLLVALPAFVTASAMERGLLACFMGLPFIAAAMLVLVPPIPSFRARLAYLCTWGGVRPVRRRERSFDASALLQLIMATVVLGVAIAAVKAVPDHGAWLPVRWLAGGMVIFAFAEMVTASLPLVTAPLGLIVPSVMQSPWRSVSIGEFWTRRWNLPTSELFRQFFFAPLARRGVAAALFAAFAASALAHALLACLVLGRWGISLACGAFFLVQPLLIATERRLKVRRWRPVAARAWTLTALALTSPLFVEPGLQFVEKAWGAPDEILQPTLAVLSFVLICSAIIALVSLPLSHDNRQLTIDD